MELWHGLSELRDRNGEGQTIFGMFLAKSTYPCMWAMGLSLSHLLYTPLPAKSSYVVFIQLFNQVKSNVNQGGGVVPDGQFGLGIIFIFQTIMVHLFY